jgi:MFS family permease
MRLILRRIRGAFGNALVWGVGWFVAGCALFLGFTLFDQHSTELSWRLVRFMLKAGVGIGIAGAVTGGLFSAFVAANFRNKKLRDVSAARFALGGTLVTTLVVVGVTFVGSLFSDWPFFLRDLAQPLLTFVPVGAITAFGSIKLAQRELPAHEESARLEGRSEEHLPLPRQPTV